MGQCELGHASQPAAQAHVWHLRQWRSDVAGAAIATGASAAALESRGEREAAPKPGPALVTRQWLTPAQRHLPDRAARTLGQDLWLQLDPLFPTSRSALGIHNCYPGVGCICIPDREQLSSLADAVRRYNINRLKVVD